MDQPGGGDDELVVDARVVDPAEEQLGLHVDFSTLERRVRDSGRFVAAVARNGLPELAT